MFLAAIYKSPQKLWSDADVIGQLGFRNKLIRAGDLKAKHMFGIVKVGTPQV
jgi:hypothetical protein